MKIITLTLCPAIDIHVETDRFALGQENKGRITSAMSGGKGVNLSRALNSAGLESICCVMVGDEDFDTYVNGIKGDKISLLTKQTHGSIRRNYNIHSPSADTVLATDGFRLSENDLAELENIVLPLVDLDTIICLCGRIADGVDVERVVDFIMKAKSIGARILVDSKSVNMDHIRRISPYLIKPNEQEAKEMLGISVDENTHPSELRRMYGETGCHYVLLTLGDKGAYLMTPSRTLYANSPAIEVKSTTGAGDSSIGGFLYAVNGGYDEPSALSYAVAFGSAAASEAGTEPPDMSRVEALLKEIRIVEK